MGGEWELAGQSMTWPVGQYSLGWHGVHVRPLARAVRTILPRTAGVAAAT